MSRTRVYRNGKMTGENFPVEQVSDHLAEDDTVVWLDVCRPTETDFKTVVEELGLHSLAVEDAMSPRERPKLDHYDSHRFMTAYAVEFDDESGTLSTHQVSAFITPRALVTVRADDSFDVEAVVRRWDGQSDLAQHGVAFLLYGLLDEIVDQHFDVAQRLDQALDDLEDKLFEESPSSVREVQRRSFRLRKALVALRRVVLPMREVVNELMRSNTKLIDHDMTPYYQDVYDHVMRAGEWTESLRDFVATILETNLTVQGNRLNSVMKKVTSWAAIIAVPTAITGFYGQNIPFPGYGKPLGFATSSILIVALSGALYAAFRRKDWL